MIKNKFLIPLGAIATVVPVVAVVSCGTNKDATPEELGVYKDLTSSTALKILENKWQEKVIGITLDNSDAGKQWVERITATDLQNQVLAQAKFYIFNKVKADKRYLWNLGQTLLSTSNSKDSHNQEWMNENGILREYAYGSLSFGATAGNAGNKATGLTDEGLKFILSNDKLDIKSEVLKQLVIEKYLQVNKDNYALAFPGNSYSSIDNMVDVNDFVLVREMLNQKLFAKWEASLDSFASPAFAGKSAPFANVLADIKGNEKAASGNGNVFEKLKRSEKLNTFNANQFNFGAANAELARIGAFKGISSMSAVGTKKLSFTEDSLRAQMTSIDKWEGFVQENDIINSGDSTNVNYIPEKTSTVKLTYVKGIMPINDNGTLKCPTVFSKDQATVGNIYQLLALNTSLYDEALKYFTTKRGDAENQKAVILEIINKTYEGILIDKLGVKFVKERKAE